jgi:hypothetical protein
MRYTLVTASGKVMQFFIRELAETYQIFEGGTVIEEKA